jgi:outer membrane receptor protein involved in Fe transport
MAQDDDVIEEIQVTATRRPVSISKISAALTVVTSDEIARARLVTDSLAAKPGVFLQQTTPGQGAAIVRGLKGSEVLHLVDGMRLNNAIFRNAPTQYLALVAPGTLDRIEIVRGAPASLYGSDAVGGVVQALSRVPEFSSPGQRGNAYLAVDTADLAKIVRGSYEFGNAGLAALVSGEYLETGNRRIGGGERIAPSGYESRGGRVAVSATPTDGESWLFDLQMARQPMTPRVDELVPGFGQTEPSSSEFFFAPNDRVFAHIRHTREQWLWNAAWNFDLGWQRIVDDRISRNYLSDIRRHEQNSSDLAGLSIDASNETESGSWVAGIEFYHDWVASQRQEEDLNTGVVQDVVSRFPDGSTVDQAAIFGNYMHQLSERHSLSGGLRFSSTSTELPDVGIIPATSTGQDDFSADLGWVFDLDRKTQLMANLGYGFRAPNVFDLGTLGERPGNRFNIPNPDLKSERITQFDIGIRHYGDRWQIDAVAFALHYTDRITSVLTGGITPDGRDITQSRNIDTADIHGIEVGGRVVLRPELVADLVINYLRGEQVDLSGVASPGDRIPPLNGRLGLTWDISGALSLEPFLIFAAGQDRLSPRDVMDPRIDPAGTPGWMTANLRADWALNDRWRFSATLENILDKRYRVHGSGVDSVGRNLYVSIQSDW